MTKSPFNPFIDRDCIVHIGDWLRQSKLLTYEDYLAILPEHKISSLTLEGFNRNLLYAGIHLVLQMSLTQYWIIGATSEIRTIDHRCVVRTRDKSRAETQLICDLASPTLTLLRSFSHTRIDYAASYLIPSSSRHGIKSHKARMYVQIVCANTKPEGCSLNCFSSIRGKRLTDAGKRL